MDEQRRNREGPRPTFAALARTAIERAVPETRSPDAVWHQTVNLAWVRWREDGRWTYLDLHRHLDWITGEYGVATEPRAMRELPAVQGAAPRDDRGARIALGELLGEQDRSWRAGADQGELEQRLEWMALQLRVKGVAYFGRATRTAR
jgi:hypothetical protein